MIQKGPGWSHSLHLIELFPDLTIFLNFLSQGAAQQQFKSVVFLVSGVVRPAGGQTLGGR
jgi:murein endopeptidase